MSTSPMIVLGYWNLESIQQAQKRQSLQQTRFGVTTTKPLPSWTTFWLPLKGHEFAEKKRTTCLRKVKIETIVPRRKEEKHSHVSCEITHERKLHKFLHMNRRTNPYAQGAECWCPFFESMSKVPYGGKPNEKQGPKAYQEDQIGNNPQKDNNKKLRVKKERRERKKVVKRGEKTRQE